MKDNNRIWKIIAIVALIISIVSIALSIAFYQNVSFVNGCCSAKLWGDRAGMFFKQKGGRPPSFRMK